MAENYVLVTDSACDIHPDKLAEWNVKMIPLAFLFTDTGVEQKEHEEPVKEFFQAMRSGRVAKTSCVNEDAFEKLFTEILEEGKDLLYLGFSTGLYNRNYLRAEYNFCQASANMAAKWE